MTKLKQIEYGGWSNCYSISNNIIEMVITGEVGPRIIRFGFIDDDNEVYNDSATLGQTGGDEWCMYGGHRFWHAPESDPRTYFPDNQPVTLEEYDGFVRIVQPMETTTGMAKELDIYMSDGTAHVRVVHRMRNMGMWTAELAPWALSVMAAGGRAIVPIPPRGLHSDNLLPSNTLTIWAYTNMSDPRWTWGERFILLQQDSTATTPQKLGVDVKDNWAAYAHNGHLFLKMFERVDNAAYPDLGCTVEIFTNDYMLELETLGPLTQLEPGGEVEHIEDWFLYNDVQTPKSDNDVDTHVLPLVAKARQQLGDL